MPDDWIRQWGDPILRQRAQSVQRRDEALLHQARRMQDRLLAADGAGLAATQVGVLRRLFVYRITADGPIQALVNPRVIDASTERAMFPEGCLSFFSVVVAVERPVAVRVAAHDLDGHDVTIDCEGFAASLMQHEIDHLDGIITLDRADPVERWRATVELAAIGQGDEHTGPAELAA